MSLTILDNQARQGVTVNQHAVIVMSERAGRVRKPLVRHYHSARTALSVHRSKCTNYRVFANPAGLALEAAQKMGFASGEE